MRRTFRSELERFYYSAGQTYVATCPEGEVGESVSVTKTAVSLISQADAEAKALAAATVEALSLLVCLTRYAFIDSETEDTFIDSETGFTFINLE